jgi:hypothetical protein
MVATKCNLGQCYQNASRSATVATHSISPNTARYCVPAPEASHQSFVHLEEDVTVIMRTTLCLGARRAWLDEPSRIGPSCTTLATVIVALPIAPRSCHLV